MGWMGWDEWVDRYAPPGTAGCTRTASNHVPDGLAFLVAPGVARRPPFLHPFLVPGLVQVDDGVEVQVVWWGMRLGGGPVGGRGRGSGGCGSGRGAHAVFLRHALCCLCVVCVCVCVCVLVWG